MIVTVGKTPPEMNSITPAINLLEAATWMTFLAPFKSTIAKAR